MLAVFTYLTGVMTLLCAGICIYLKEINMRLKALESKNTDETVNRLQRSFQDLNTKFETVKILNQRRS